MFKIFDFKKGKEMEKEKIIYADKIKELEDKIAEKKEKIIKLQTVRDDAIKSVREECDKEIGVINETYRKGRELIDKEYNELTKELLNIKNKQRDIEKEAMQNSYDKYMKAKEEYESLCKKYNKDVYIDGDTGIVFDFSDLAKVLDELFEKYEK